MTEYLADVSEFQETVDWPAYGAAYHGVIVRAHNGWRPDNYWARNRDGARQNVLWRGFYQYLPASVDPVAAARAFQATTGPLLPGEVAILDLEEGSGDQRGRRQAWLDTLQDDIEWTYSGLAFARARLPGVGIEWVAAYGQSEPTVPHTLWQYTDAQVFAGIAKPCDGSIFHGTITAGISGGMGRSIGGGAPTLTATTSPATTPTPAPIPEDDDMITLILWCYTNLVGRAPSVTEVENWITGTAGQNAAQVRDGFRNALAEPASVTAAYAYYLGRLPESQQVITDRLASKPTIGQVRIAVAQSPEAVARAAAGGGPYVPPTAPAAAPTVTAAPAIDIPTLAAQLASHLTITTTLTGA